MAGLIAATFVFGSCVLASCMDAITPASLSISFRPWWRERNWLFAISGGLVFGLLGALRPETKPKNNR